MTLFHPIHHSSGSTLSPPSPVPPTFKMAFTIILLSVLGASVPDLAARKYQARDLATQATLLRFCGLFIAQYLLVTFYRVIVYPHFVSPMRHLPGPKVGSPA